MKDYRSRRAACVASGQAWFPDPESELQTERQPEPEQRQRFSDEDREALLKNPEAPQGWYSSLTSASGVVLAAGLSLAAGLGVVAWWLTSPPPEKKEDK